MRKGADIGRPKCGAVSNNSGITSVLPYYSVNAPGAQGNFMMPKIGLTLFFKYYREHSAKGHVQGRTIVFGGSWTLKIPTK